MVTSMAYQLASFSGFLSARRAVRLRDVLAARPWQRAIARFARTGFVHRQSYLDGRCRNDFIRAAVSVQAQIGDRDGRRTAARIASRTGRRELVRTAVESSELPLG